MIPRKIKRARNMLLAAIIAAILIIGGVTGLYYWKGLDALQPKDQNARSYYVAY